MKILLVTSPHLDHTVFHRRRPWGAPGTPTSLAQPFIPMGLLSLAGAINGAAEVAIADINKAINAGTLPMSPAFYETAADWILESTPDLVGFMTEADSYHHLLQILQALKRRRSSPLSLLGGPHASAVHRETIEAFPAIDFVVRGEGEIALPALVAALMHSQPLSTVGNLTYRAADRVIVNTPLPLIDDLDALPWPDLSRVAVAPDDQLWVEIGRGCPFKCNFCFTAPYWQRKHRIKSAPRILRELAYFKTQYGRTDFNFTHDLFTTDRRWVLDFCRQLAASGLNVTWTCSSRTDTIDDEQIEALAKAGCRNIYFGVETGNADMQHRIDKGLDLGEARAIVRRAAQSGIAATVGFIAGLPGESESSLRDTLNEAFFYLSLPDTVVHLFGFSPYRGSAHFDRIEHELQLDRYFVDFPLPFAMHADNCALMDTHRAVFSRYSWLQSYDDLDPGTLCAAEEFFPMVNALKSLMIALHARRIDPLALLQGWSTWIRSTNLRGHGDMDRGLYQGTIAEFLEFLQSFLNARPADPFLAEMIEWELAKNQLRTECFDLPIPALFKTDGAFPPLSESATDGIDTRLTLHGDISTNPTAVLHRFDYADVFLGAHATPRPSTFVFYRTYRGTPAIVRVGPLAQCVLEVARPGLPVLTLLEGLHAGEGTAHNVSPEIIESLVLRLRALDLLRHTSSSPDECTESIVAFPGSAGRT